MIDPRWDNAAFRAKAAELGVEVVSAVLVHDEVQFELLGSRAPELMKWWADRALTEFGPYGPIEPVPLTANAMNQWEDEDE